MVSNRANELASKTLRLFLDDDQELHDQLCLHLGREKIHNLTEMCMAVRRGLGLDQDDQPVGSSAMAVDTAGTSGAGSSSGAGASSAPST